MLEEVRKAAGVDLVAAAAVFECDKRAAGAGFWLCMEIRSWSIIVLENRVNRCFTYVFREE